MYCREDLGGEERTTGDHQFPGATRVGTASRHQGTSNSTSSLEADLQIGRQTNIGIRAEEYIGHGACVSRYR